MLTIDRINEIKAFWVANRFNKGWKLTELMFGDDDAMEARCTNSPVPTVVPDGWKIVIAESTEWLIPVESELPTYSQGCEREDNEGDVGYFTYSVWLKINTAMKWEPAMNFWRPLQEIIDQANK